MKEFRQHHGTYYEETFSPVEKLETFRSYISILVNEELHFTVWCIFNVFLLVEYLKKQFV